MRTLKMILIISLVLSIGGMLFADDVKQNAVKKQKVYIGQSINVEKGEKIKELVVIFGDANVYGKVEDNVVVIFGKVKVFSGAVIDGDLISVGGKHEVESGAYVSGDQVGITPTKIFENFPSATKIFAGLAILGFWLKFISMLTCILIFLALGALIQLFLPKHMENIKLTIEAKPWKACLYGVLIYLCVVPALILLIISLVGILFIPLYILFLVVVFAFMYSDLCYFIGKKLPIKSFKGKNFLPLAAGIILVELVKLVPFLGFMVILFVSAFALGALALSRFGTKQAL